MESKPIDIETLLPHRGRMRLVEQIVALDENHTVTRATVRPGWPMSDGQSVSAVILIELVAQTAGIHNGWVRVRRYGPEVDRKGWIVGISEADLHVDRVACGTPLTLRAENRFAYEGFREVGGTVETGGQVLAEAVLLLLRSGEESVLP